MQIRFDYYSRLAKVEREIEVQKRKLDVEEIEEMVDEWLSRRLDAGLFEIQNADTILAWLCAEDGGARRRIMELLEERKAGPEVIKKTLQGR